MSDAVETDRRLLTVTDLRTTFSIAAGDVQAVRGVSFALDRGRTLGIVGESGCGKTVLARSIMRLNLGSNVTTTGTAEFAGRDLLSLPMADMHEMWGMELAMVFQDPMTSLNPLVRVGRQVTEHLRQHLGVGRAEAARTAVDLLKEVRIPEPEVRLKAYPHELSGGMRQRICIAIALACEPSLLFADEPTTALDVTVQHQILNLLGREQRERDMAMVLVTHDLGVIAGRTDDTLVMYAGMVVEQAPTGSLFEDMRHPYSEALLRSLPRTSQVSHTRLAAITGRPPDLIDPPSGCAFSPRCPYVQPRCREEVPPLSAVDDPDHRFACWTPVGSPEGSEAFARNVAEGLPQAVAVDLTTGSSTSSGGVG
jgi:oligopeptide/dipeptide ABC transporter ATP-binding protein